MIIKHAIDIKASPADLFDLTQNYALRPLWDSLTPRAFLLRDEPAPALGAMVRCSSFRDFISMDVRYVSYQRPRLAAFEMVRGSRWIASLAGSWTFTAVSHQTTRMVFTYNLRSRIALLQPFMRWVFERETLKRMRRLKELVEQNQTTAFF